MEKCDLMFERDDAKYEAQIFRYRYEKLVKCLKIYSKTKYWHKYNQADNHKYMAIKCLKEIGEWDEGIDRDD